MTEENQTPVEATEQSPAMEYQQETPQPAMEQSETVSTDQMNLARERAAFETYLETSGQEVPENFADAGAYFDSLKEAQKLYTQGQQELSTMRQQMDTMQRPAATPEPAPEAQPVDPNAELRIEGPNIPEESPESPFNDGLNQEMWDDWAYEVATTGTLSDVTRQQVMSTTGFTEGMINEYLAGQKARMRESYSHASSVVGGQEQLQNMLKWASETMSEEERYSINAGLGNKDLQDITLRGLSAKYNEAIKNSPKAKEPMVPQNREAVSNTTQTYPPYSTKREFTADRNNPRFTIEPKFREAVEQRMARTNWNTLPE